MRALQLITPGKPLELRHLAELDPSGDEVVVEVRASGICRSDVHYRAGFPKVGPLPLTLGHEVAGVVAGFGDRVLGIKPGDRVCVHYQVGCGECVHCAKGLDQFCSVSTMVGNGRNGGYADQIMVPARNVIPVPDSVALEHAAVMMCSSSTSLHALRKGRLASGESVAVFGSGGLGMSAIQLAFIEGASRVFAVDINPDKLAAARRLGAIPVDATGDPSQAIRDQGGCEVALDLVGSVTVLRQALDALNPMGRAVAVGLTPDTMPVGPYRDLVIGERELIGTSDHLASEIRELLDHAAARRLVLDDIVGHAVPLEAEAVNRSMDELEHFGGAVRTVITPQS